MTSQDWNDLFDAVEAGILKQQPPAPDDWYQDEYPVDILLDDEGNPVGVETQDVDDIMDIDFLSSSDVNDPEFWAWILSHEEMEG